MSTWNARFFETTRGRIVTLLRPGGRTVHGLAEALELSTNTVRSHLTSLERDGVVQHAGVRRGGGAGKPAGLYQLAPDVELRFSRAYPPFLASLLTVLSQRLAPAELERLMREVGRQMAPARVAGATFSERVRLASNLLNDLGGSCQVEGHEGRLSITGHGCPLGAVVADRPEVCAAIRALLTHVTGGRVHERCVRDERPRCRFEVLQGGEVD